MKISELISKLSIILESHGDVPVLTYGMDEAGLKDMRSVTTERVANVEPRICYDMLLLDEVSGDKMVGDPFDAVVID